MNKFIKENFTFLTKTSEDFNSKKELDEYVRDNDFVKYTSEVKIDKTQIKQSSEFVGVDLVRLSISKLREQIQLSFFKKFLKDITGNRKPLPKENLLRAFKINDYKFILSNLKTFYEDLGLIDSPDFVYTRNISSEPLGFHELIGIYHETPIWLTHLLDESSIILVCTQDPNILIEEIDVSPNMINENEEFFQISYEIWYKISGNLQQQSNLITYAI